MTITAAADGSSLGNPGPAGWAWYVDEDTWDAGGWPRGTNNLGELTAILRLLEATAHTGEELHILADSQYAINVVSKWRLGWKKRGWTKADKKPIKNLELIQEIDRAMEGRRVTFEWVKGHAGHHMNERADDLARSCAEAYQAGRTPEPGPGFGGGADGSRGAAPTSESDDAAPAPASAGPRGADTTRDVPVGDSAARDTATAGTDTSHFRSHPSVLSSPSEVDEPTRAVTASSKKEASERIASVSAVDAVAREREFILAWTGGDDEALAGMTDERTTRIWPGGGATTTLAGPSPASPSIGRIDVHDLGGAFLTRYRVRWEGGASLESSVWAQATSGQARLIMVHHQSTLIA